MKKSKQGFIKISRGFLDDPLYTSGEAFSLKDVYIDLTLRAFYQDTTKTFKNKMRTYHRGQVEGSTRQFAEWWNMSRETVLRRLKVLQENGYIYVESTKVQTVITLRKYCMEQDFEGMGCDTDKTTDQTTNQTTHKTTEQTTDKTNYKKDKEVIKKTIKNQKKEPSADFGFVKDGMKYE